MDTLIAELNRKVARILAYEKAYLHTKGKPFFRQNIYGVYNALQKVIQAIDNIGENVRN